MVTVQVTCVRRFCDEAATTVRDDVELCAFCAAEHDWFAQRRPIGLAVVSASPTSPVDGRCPYCDGSGCNRCNNGWIWI